MVLDSSEHPLVPNSMSIPEGIPCFPPSMKAEMGRHARVPWWADLQHLAGVKGKPPHIFSIPKEVLGVVFEMELGFTCWHLS